MNTRPIFVLYNLDNSPPEETRARGAVPEEDIIGGRPRPGDGTTLEVGLDGKVRRVPELQAGGV